MPIQEREIQDLKRTFVKQMSKGAILLALGTGLWVEATHHIDQLPINKLYSVSQELDSLNTASQNLINSGQKVQAEKITTSAQYLNLESEQAQVYQGAENGLENAKKSLLASFVGTISSCGSLIYIMLKSRKYLYKRAAIRKETGNNF